MRLDKYLKKNGYGTKEVIHHFIQEGKVMVNGKVISDFHLQLEENDVISISNDIKKYKDHYYLILNKPIDYVSARNDKTNQTILSLLPSFYDKSTMNIVGRLDKDVTGLILLTNDSKLYKRIIEPSREIEKVYLVSFSGNHHLINKDYSNGLSYSNGTKTKPFVLEFLDDNNAKITLHEGKYHEIKKIFNELNLFVLSIHRIKISTINLGDLKEGCYRELLKEEIDSLKEALQLS